VASGALIAGGVIVAGRGDSTDPVAQSSSLRRLVAPAALVLVSVAAIGAILVPLTEQLAINQSQAAAARGQLSTALRDSLTAQRLEPYAAGPRLQEALVLEEAGELESAAAAAQAATARGSTDWTTWLTLARIDARRGAAVAAVAALGRARALNPRSTLFQQP
jgi:tetratricopeptide (TPR) repeat protein